MHMKVVKGSKSVWLIFGVLLTLFTSNCAQPSRAKEFTENPITITRWRCTYENGSVACSIQARRNSPNPELLLGIELVREFYDEAGNKIDICNCDKNNKVELKEEDKPTLLIVESADDEGLVIIVYVAKKAPSTVKRYDFYFADSESKKAVSNTVRGDLQIL